MEVKFKVSEQLFAQLVTFNFSLKYRGSPTSTVSTSTNSTSTIFSAIGIKFVLSGISSIAYVVKFVLVEIDYAVPTSTNFA